MPVANEGLYGSSGIPFIKNIMILVVTDILGRGTTQDIKPESYAFSRTFQQTILLYTFVK